MSDSLAILTHHVVTTLPDSLREQRVLLAALHHIVGPDHPARKTIAKYRDALDDLERVIQPQLAAEFEQLLPQQQALQLQPRKK
jgi:hypothetical protein